MRSYLASIILGVAVGVVYGLVKVRSPAPPAIALLGLLGILAGEQAHADFFELNFLIFQAAQRLLPEAFSLTHAFARQELSKFYRCICMN